MCLPSSLPPSEELSGATVPPAGGGRGDPAEGAAAAPGGGGVSGSGAGDGGGAAGCGGCRPGSGPEPLSAAGHRGATVSVWVAGIRDRCIYKHGVCDGKREDKLT